MGITYAHPDEAKKQVMRAKGIYDVYRWGKERKKYLGVYRDILGSE